MRTQFLKYTALLLQYVVFFYISQTSIVNFLRSDSSSRHVGRDRIIFAKNVARTRDFAICSDAVTLAGKNRTHTHARARVRSGPLRAKKRIAHRGGVSQSCPSRSRANLQFLGKLLEITSISATGLFSPAACGFAIRACPTRRSIRSKWMDAGRFRRLTVLANRESGAREKKKLPPSNQPNCSLRDIAKRGRI